MVKKIVITVILLFILSGCGTDKADKNHNDNNYPEILDQSIEHSDEYRQNQSTQNDDQSLTETKIGIEEREKPIVLYQGITLDDTDRKIKIEANQDEAEINHITGKYSREYYLYSNQEFLGKDNGTVEIRGFDYFWDVDFENPNDFEVAISQPYDPYPRKITNNYSKLAAEIKNKSTVIAETNKKFGVDCEIKEVFSVDLDGDSEEEHLITLFDIQNCFFSKCLVDSKYKIISYLILFHEETSETNMDILLEYFGDSLSSSEIIDIDNDSIMEILMQIPSFEGFLFKVFKYDNGRFSGDYITEATFQCYSDSADTENDERNNIYKGKYKKVKEKAWEEFRTYSPNKVNYISDIFEGEEDGDLCKVKIYLNGQKLIDEKKDFHLGKYSRSNGGIWIDNENVLIKGEYLLNIKDFSKQQIDFSSVLEEGLYIHNYSINHSKNKIAYVIVGNYYESIYIYDIENSTWELVAKFEYKHTYHEFYHIAWGVNDDIYFDTADIEYVSEKFDKYKWIYKVYKINSKDRAVSVIKSDHMLKTFSGNMRYMVLFSPITYQYIVIDTEQNKELLRFSDDNLVSHDDKFVIDSDNDVIAYYGEDNTIFVYSLRENKVLSAVDVSNITRSGYKIYDINYLNDRIVFYAYNGISPKSAMYEICL